MATTPTHGTIPNSASAMLLEKAASWRVPKELCGFRIRTDVAGLERGTCTENLLHENTKAAEISIKSK